MKKALKKFLVAMLSIGVIGTMTNTVDAASKIPADAKAESASTIQVEIFLPLVSASTKTVLYKILTPLSSHISS